MTSQTYSLSIVGVGSHNQFEPKTLTISDPNAQAGSQQSDMRTGKSFLVKMPDGSERLHRFDAERSTPALPVLIRV
jgi:hypothetical protein